MKFFNRWLTPEEEERLKLPSRRVFCIGALSTLCLAAAPEGFRRLGNLYVQEETVWRPAIRINWVGGPPNDLHPSLYESIINDIKIHARHLCGVSMDRFRYRWTPDPFHVDNTILTVETSVPGRNLKPVLFEVRLFEMSQEMPELDPDVMRVVLL